MFFKCKITFDCHRIEKYTKRRRSLMTYRIEKKKPVTYRVHELFGIFRCGERSVARVNASRRCWTGRGRRRRSGWCRRLGTSSAASQSRIRTNAAVHVFVSVEQHTDIPVARLESDLQSRTAVLVNDRRVAVRMREELSHNVDVIVFSGAHQSRASIFVLNIDRGSGVQEQLRYVFTSVRRRQHKRSLPVL